MTRPTHTTFQVFAWNPKTGRDADLVKAALEAFIEETGRPHVVELAGEAAGYGAALNAVAAEHGYVRVQLRRRFYPKRAGRRRLIEEDANVAVLVRDDVKILRSSEWRMLRRFRGAMHGWEHAPRVYRRMLLRVPGFGKVRFSAGHWPTLTPESNEPANAETERRVGRWFRLSWLPAVHVGDLNRFAAWLRKRFPGLRVIAGHGPDNALTNNKLEGDAEVLGKKLSDHHGIHYTFWRTA